MTRIGVNLLWLVPGEVGGSEEYTIGLLRALRQLNVDQLEVVLYVNRRFARAHRDICSSYRTMVAPIEGTSRPLRVLVESTWLVRRCRRDRLEAMHHARGTMPPVRSVAGIITLHDLQPITHPERFGPMKGLYIRLLVPRSLRAAARVVCLSAFTENDAVSVAGVERDRILRVPSGIDPIIGAPSPEQIAEVLATFDIAANEFVLYPAITYDHKNHRTLVEAFAYLHGTHPNLRLVLTGGIGPAEAAVLEQIARLGIADSVRRTGRIPTDQLDVLYRTAAVMAFTSAYEGFGLPLLEAMARGCPVVASNVGGLAEVGGDAVGLVDPFDVNRWIAALARVIDDDGYRSGTIMRGLEQSGRYQWSHSASALAGLYLSFSATRPTPSAS
jgi:alpha-1,3-rhamnosyl/mannosyltransferase